MMRRAPISLAFTWIYKILIGGQLHERPYANPFSHITNSGLELYTSHHSGAEASDWPLVHLQLVPRSRREVIDLTI